MTPAGTPPCTAARLPGSADTRFGACPYPRCISSTPPSGAGQTRYGQTIEEVRTSSEEGAKTLRTFPLTTFLLIIINL